VLFLFAADTRGAYVENCVSGGVVSAHINEGFLKIRTWQPRQQYPMQGDPLAYLLDVVDDNLGETATQDTERRQNGAKCIDPHEFDRPL